jgi:hypothetical protein
VLDRLAVAELDEVIEPALQPWARRAWRLQRRDVALRALAGEHYLECGTGRAAAAAIARDLRRYAASGWRVEQGKSSAGDGKRRAMHRILTLSDGKAVGKDRIREILAGLAENDARKPATRAVILRRSPKEAG